MASFPLVSYAQHHPHHGEHHESGRRGHGGPCHGTHCEAKRSENGERTKKQEEALNDIAKTKADISKQATSAFKNGHPFKFRGGGRALAAIAGAGVILSTLNNVKNDSQGGKIVLGSPTPTPGPTANSNPVSKPTNSALVLAPPPQTGGSCQSVGTTATQVCDQALARTKELAARAESYNASLESQSNAIACGKMGDMANRSAQEMQALKGSCQAHVAACVSSCSNQSKTYQDQTGSTAENQYTSGVANTGLCQNAEGSMAAMEMNITQMQTAATQANQCYAQITGQNIPADGVGEGSASQDNAASGSGAGEVVTTSQGTHTNPLSPQSSGCADGEQGEGCQGPMVNAQGSNIMMGDEDGGAGLGGAPGRGKNAWDVPVEMLNYQASSPSPGVKKSDSSLNAANAKNKPAVPGKQDALNNSKQYVGPGKDPEADRRAKGYSALPQFQNPLAKENGVTTRPGQARNPQRGPASSASAMGIGGKHTNIFSSINQSYVRQSNSLSP